MSSAPVTVTLTRELGGDRLKLPALEVRLRRDQETVTAAPLELRPLVIGSGSDCDLITPDRSVSRRHCSVQLLPDGVLVRDFGSKNGTLIRGVLIREALLPLNEEAVIGHSSFEIAQSGQETTVALSDGASFGGVLGASVIMRSVFAKLQAAAKTDETVLLLGETGTGKGSLACAIHDQSPRRAGPFVTLDCGAVPADLMEDELFGHVKGAFTGATADRPGLLLTANGGTMFLDEVGELPTALQTKLLRVMDTREFWPLGGKQTMRVDVRFIGATHRNLKTRMASSEFRADLYFRLAVLEVHVPPLRERRSDVLLLIQHFSGELDPPRKLSDWPPHVLELLQSYAWPGNVRELKNAVVRFAILPDMAAAGMPGTGAAAPDASWLDLPLKSARQEAITDFERRYLLHKLSENAGNVTAAAKAMGVSRQLVHRMLARYESTDE